MFPTTVLARHASDKGSEYGLMFDSVDITHHDRRCKFNFRTESNKRVTVSVRYDTDLQTLFDNLDRAVDERFRIREPRPKAACRPIRLGPRRLYDK